MPSEIRIRPDETFIRWTRNFAKLGTKPISPAAVAEWEIGTEILFDLTQQYAHIDSSDMKRSGKFHMQRPSTTEITGVITYGGTRKSDAKPWWKHHLVDYTKYEVARGGEHDFITRARRASEHRLQKLALKALEKHIGSERW
jgi:uncharacterized protein YprB with RNaseH-like and TPR domain